MLYLYKKKKMKILFKNKLSETTQKTVSNPYYKPEKHVVTEKDLNEVTEIVNYYTTKYGDDPFFNDVTSGDGVYLVIVSKSGAIHPNNVKIPNYRFHPGDVGNVTGTQHGNIMILIRANKWGELSGAAVARIKTYVIFGDYIIDMVKNQTKDSYLDDNIEVTQKTDKLIQKKEQLDSLDDFKEKAKKISKILTQKEKDEILRKYAKENNVSVLEIGPRERVKIFLDYLEKN